MPKIYKVGGCVRDRILGVATKDIDFTFVLDDLSGTPEDGFARMRSYMESEGYEIFLCTPDCFTIRAKFPKGHAYDGLSADFVMARKEIGYEDGTRKPVLALGTLEDDLERRDFTVNAMAETESGEVIDLFDGMNHLRQRLLITPLDPARTFMDDPLRMLRAIRFAVTKDFQISESVWCAMFQPGLIERLRTTVSQERIREEMYKALLKDTKRTLRLLYEIDEHKPEFVDAIFDRGLWLKPTFEKK